MIRTTKMIKSLAPALVVAAALAPTASALTADGYTTDARHAALVIRHAQPQQPQNLSSPDSRDSTRAAQPQDLSAPDSHGIASRPGPAPTPSTASNGTDWGDVGIVVGSSLAGLMLALGCVAYFARRGRRFRKLRTPVVSG
jgi:hypothetical protein